MVDALEDTKSGKKAIKKYGTTFYGYSGMKTHLGTDVVQGSTSQTFHIFNKKAEDVYINLDDFNSDLTAQGMDYKNLDKYGYNSRVFNMARVFEHEWLGHGINHKKMGMKANPEG